MTIRHLKIFTAVAECGSMHGAAKKLYITQPTVSQAIAELEKHYHILLFERLSKKLYITAAGKQFLFYANNILSLFNEMEQQLNNASTNAELKIGATITIGTCIISTLLNQFRSFYPQAALKVFIDTPTRLANGLARNDLDIALVETMPSNSELVYEPFLDDTMVLVCSPDHPFAKTGRATLTQISQENYIARESNSREIFAEYMELHNHPLNATWFCNNSETTKQAVAHNYGITVISRRIVASELENGSLVEIQMENCQINRKFWMLWHKNKFFTNPLLDFMDLCRDLDITL
ncbi:MAG: LysR family transcriptional regulator [Lachnospiraceae bacterium]|nr:LysR family transcriptional regulator [Lachnospiraceae bacterium]